MFTRVTNPVDIGTLPRLLSTSMLSIRLFTWQDSIQRNEILSTLRAKAIRRCHGVLVVTLVVTVHLKAGSFLIIRRVRFLPSSSHKRRLGFLGNRRRRRT